MVTELMIPGSPRFRRPHGTARSTQTSDLSATFRLSQSEMWCQHFQCPHVHSPLSPPKVGHSPSSVLCISLFFFEFPSPRQLSGQKKRARNLKNTGYPATRMRRKNAMALIRQPRCHRAPVAGSECPSLALSHVAATSHMPLLST